MSDHISYNLANKGYNIVKYVPYGPVKEVLPYLVRRAEENRSIAGQTSRELNLIIQEIKKENQIKKKLRHLQSAISILSKVDVLSQSSTLNLENFSPVTSIRYVLHLPPTSLALKSTAKSVSKKICSNELSVILMQFS